MSKITENLTDIASISDIETQMTGATSAIVANTAKVSNVSHPLVQTAVPVGAVFTDTNTWRPAYNHPTYAGDDFSVDTGALTGATVVSDIDINVTTDGIGHVTDANGVISTRTLTLANLGYTGATNANNYTYTHPTFAGDDINLDTGPLSGATVISDLDFNVTTDTNGHVTDANATVATRNLTAANIGAAASSHTHAYLPNTHDMTLTLSGDATGSATFTNMGDATLDVTVVNGGGVPDFNNVSFTGSITEEVYNLTGTVLEPTNGTIQTKVLSGATTFTQSIGVGEYIILHLSNGGTYPVTWPSISWVTGVAPTLVSSSYTSDVIVLYKVSSPSAQYIVGAYIGEAV